MKYNKEELEDLIFNQKMSYIKIGEKYGVSDTYIKKIANRLGIKLKVRSKFPENWKPANYNTREKVYCLNCNEECDVYSKKYCSAKCQQEYQSNLRYIDFIDNNNEYCRENYSPSVFKPRFLIEQDGKCSICNMSNEWNNQILVFILDHIDGNAANNNRNNLRLVCPNCDSQLDTYKSKNKNSARKYRYLKQKKENVLLP
jgi:hypothetical protein